MVTRYYRPPELTLLRFDRAARGGAPTARLTPPARRSADYTGAVDVWSMGCIFAELLHTLEPSAPRDSKRILFPGDSGYPVRLLPSTD